TDGHMEVVSSLFDGLSDKRWHLSIFDAVSGDEKANALDLVAIASVQLWGTNGPRALLCIRSSRIEYEPGESYEAWRLLNGKLEKIWSETNAPFLPRAEPSNDRRGLGFTGMKLQWVATADVDGDGRLEFFTTKKDDPSAPQAWGIGKD